MLTYQRQSAMLSIERRQDVLLATFSGAMRRAVFDELRALGGSSLGNSLAAVMDLRAAIVLEAHRHTEFAYGARADVPLALVAGADWRPYWDSYCRDAANAGLLRVCFSSLEPALAWAHRMAACLAQYRRPGSAYTAQT